MGKIADIAERMSKLIGSWRFVLGQTILIALYITTNTLLPEKYQFDPFPFIFLNLMLSFQASYMALIILISNNQMSDQDRRNNLKILSTVKKLESKLLAAIDEEDT